MSHWYTNALEQLGEAALNLNGGHDMRVAILMTNTTADTEKDKATISGFTTLDEYDGANYGRKTLANEAMLQDDGDLRGAFDADDLTNALTNAWENLGAGTRQAAGLLVFRHVTNDTDSVPVLWIDSGGFPFSGNGGRVEVTWHAEGLAYLQG